MGETFYISTPVELQGQLQCQAVPQKRNVPLVVALRASLYRQRRYWQDLAWKNASQSPQFRIKGRSFVQFVSPLVEAHLCAHDFTIGHFETGVSCSPP